jgi:uncharacterized repeat protein (TIGR03803 family)
MSGQEWYPLSGRSKAAARRGGNVGKPNWGKRACAVILLCATRAVALRAQTLPTIFSTLQSLDYTDGDFPYAGLVQATTGNLYGTAQYGGADGFGTVFNISPDGVLTRLYSFCPQGGCTGSSFPRALIQGTDGNFYGTTGLGGANGYGTVFKITPAGTLTTLYNFCSQSGCTDGYEPWALVEGTDGNFYGTTYYGGASGDGTVFKITSDGTLTTLYSFCSQTDCSDGGNPAAGLVQASDGNFYGTTTGGAQPFMGTVFRITPGGSLRTLYRFCSQEGVCPDGYCPRGALLQAGDGNFYGTTVYGGANGLLDGTIFKISPSGKLTTLYSFCSQSGCTDGYQPAAGLVQGTDGNFYGTTFLGGAHSGGTAFKITPTGKLTTLHSFCSQSGCTDGQFPTDALVQDNNGKFYGTTTAGGGTSTVCPSGCGTVFSLSVGLGPFVETQPTSGGVGAAVKILGTSLTGATSVSFNGTAAAFTVLSPSLITTTVPTGATTGKVQVVTPSRTLSSNVSFRVAP